MSWWLLGLLVQVFASLVDQTQQRWEQHLFGGAVAVRDVPPMTHDVMLVGADGVCDPGCSDEDDGCSDNDRDRDGDESDDESESG